MEQPYEGNDWGNSYSLEEENAEEHSDMNMSVDRRALVSPRPSASVGPASHLSSATDTASNNHSSRTGIGNAAVPSPPPLGTMQTSTRTGRTNVPASNDGTSPSRHNIQSHRKKKSNSQALLRAKASLKCPVSYSTNGTQTRIATSTSTARANSTSANVGSSSENIAAARHSLQRATSAPFPGSRRTATRNGNASVIIETLPSHRNFGLRIADSSSSSVRSTNTISTACESKISTKGDWKLVELIQTPTHDMDVGIETSSPPCARSLHAAATWKDQMFIFGGYDGQSRRNDFYSFHFKNQQWKLLNEDTHDIRGTPPSPRDRHCAVVYNDAFYVFGGFDGSARVNDFHKYDILEQEWTRILPNVSDMTLPTSRHSHSAVVHNNSMWVFGGYDGSYRCDLYEYNFLTNVWTVVDTVGRIPRPRYRATCVIYNNCLILHGGHDGTRHLEDTHVLDLELKRWTSLVRIGNPPSSRDSHVSFIYNNAMYVVGGSAGGTAMNDMHELFMESSEDGLIPVWRTVTCSGRICPRFCHVGAVHEDSLYIFGGYDGQSRLNDFAKFDFNVDDLSYEVTPSTLLQDMHSFINNEALSDVEFIVEGETIYAHKMMLVRSSYFRAMFTGSMMESQQSTIHMEEIPACIFLMILEYLYTDQLDINVDLAMDLFAAADLFDIPRLSQMCEKKMLETIAVDNAASIFLAADRHSAKTLRTKTLKYILKHFEVVSKSAAFEEMARSNVELVVEILRQR